MADNNTQQAPPPGWSLSGILANNSAPSQQSPQAPPPSQQPPAPSPQSGSNDALQAASKQVASPHSSLPAPRPDKITRVNSASGLFGLLTMEITNAVAAHKEKKINDAMANYMTIYNAQQRAEQLVNQSGEQDPAKRQQLIQQMVSNDPSVKDTFHGPQGTKNVKAMKDLLKVDFTDPESMNTVQHQALKKVSKIIGAQDTMSLVSQIKNRFMGQQQGGQQGGQQPGQQPDVAAGVAKRSTEQLTPEPVDVKGATELGTADANRLRAQAENTRAQMEFRDKYDTKQQTDGTWVAFDKSDPTKVIPLKTPDGETVKGTGKASYQNGQPVLVNGVPTGIKRPEGVHYPGTAQWTPEDAKDLEVANQAAAKGQANKVATTEAYARARAQYLGWRAVYNKQTGQYQMASPDMMQKNPDLYADASHGGTAAQNEGRFTTLYFDVDNVNKAVDKLEGTHWDTGTRAALAAAMRDPNPSEAVSTFLNSEAAANLGDAERDYAIGIASLAESAQAMAGIQGAKGGSDRMRAAVRGMIPSAATPDANYARKQMKIFVGELDRLHKVNQRLISGAGSITGAPDDAGGAPAASSGNSRVIKYDAQGNRIQ